MSTVKYLARIIIRFMVRCLFIFPINNKVILIDSMFGKGVSDNAKYFLQYALEQTDADRYRYIWAVNHPKEYTSTDVLRYIKYGSLIWYYYHAIAKIKIYSHYIYNYIPIRDRQYNIIMWHAGGAYKRIGASSSSASDAEKKLHAFRNEYINNPMVIFLSSSVVFTQYNIKEVYGFTGRIVNTGMPRNDVFFNSQAIKEKKEKVKKQLHIGEQKILLYAPTFRNNNRATNTSTDLIDCQRVLECFRRRTNTECILLYRCHYFEHSHIMTDSSVIDVSQYPDMQELLCSADYLITDYSSCMWDYALLDRPCFLFVPDIEDYKRDERGFFTPIEQWPGIVCASQEELYDHIENLPDSVMIEKARKHLQEFGSYEEGKACQKMHKLVVELIGTEVEK